MSARRIFGLDFSGAKKAGRFIWLAEAERQGDGLRILSCRPAAELPGGAANRETALAALRDFILAAPDAIFGCDFPFSLPQALIEAKSWTDFLAQFDHASAQVFRQHCRNRTNGKEPKRATDRESRTPWSAFNVRLYHQTFHGLSGLLRPLVGAGQISVLPMQTPNRNCAWIIETCPASSLAHLGFRVPYKGAGQRDRRRWIMDRLVGHGSLNPLSPAIVATILDNPGGDALDSVIAALATASALTRIEAGAQEGDPLEGCVYFKL